MHESELNFKRLEDLTCGFIGIELDLTIETHLTLVKLLETWLTGAHLKPGSLVHLCLNADCGLLESGEDFSFGIIWTGLNGALGDNRAVGVEAMEVRDIGVGEQSMQILLRSTVDNIL